ncbi:MAG: hypothetical protein Q9199_004786, partial [Rusavskia elegans]
LVPEGLRDVLADCLPGFRGYESLADEGLSDEKHDGKRKSNEIRAVAMSGTGNGDSFLRTAATRTAAAMARFQPGRSLASAVREIAGSGGELQRSAGDRWGKTGEGEGGIIGIELVNGVAKIVADFNCGGMFRCWIDDEGAEKVMVFKEEYSSNTSQDRCKYPAIQRALLLSICRLTSPRKQRKRRSEFNPPVESSSEAPARPLLFLRFARFRKG